MVKATLLGLEPSTFASQRELCLSASRLASLFLLSIYLSFSPSLSFSSPLFQPAVFSLPFHLLSPSLSFSSISLSPPPWPLFNCSPLVFASCRSLSSCLSFTFTLSWIYLFSLHIHRSFIHHLPLFPLCPLLSSLLSLKFIDVSSLSWTFPSSIHLSTFCWFMPALGAHVQCWFRQLSPVEACVHWPFMVCTVYMDMFCSGAKLFGSSRGLSVYPWTSGTWWGVRFIAQLIPEVDSRC